MRGMSGAEEFEYMKTMQLCGGATGAVREAAFFAPAQSGCRAPKLKPVSEEREEEER